jgi:hypothetical protein
MADYGSSNEPREERYDADRMAAGAPFDRRTFEDVERRRIAEQTRQLGENWSGSRTAPPAMNAVAERERSKAAPARGESRGGGTLPRRATRYGSPYAVFLPTYGCLVVEVIQIPLATVAGPQKT